MKLIIVESPNKCAKIRGFAGSGFKVAASFGHVRDLPASGGGLQVDFRDGRIIPHYCEVKRDGFKSPIPELKALAKTCDEILLASDPDREGEAIAWHLTQVLGPHRYRRVRFHAITQQAVTAAIAAPTPLDNHLVDAQQARRVLDRVVGWIGSSVCRTGMGGSARSAGRVQSAALRIVVEREQEIRAFVPTDFFTLRAHVEAPGIPPSFWAVATSYQGKKLEKGFAAKGDADQAARAIASVAWSVTGCDRNEVHRRPHPPFMTSSLLQAASVAFGWRPEQTMKVAQGLFEGGHITYMRTDSVALEPEAVAMARDYIASHFEPGYLPAKPQVYGTKNATAQEAHEAIRPTHPESGPDAIGADEGGQLYRLIWQRFIACQMADARDAVTVITLAAGPVANPTATFAAKGKVQLFDGWRSIMAVAAEDESKQAKRKRGQKPEADDEDSDDTEEAVLPDLRVGQQMRLKELVTRKSTTQPPPRYTQASLIKKLEKDGIGRPSTFATIMRTLLDRDYVREEKRKLVATDLGVDLVAFLMRFFQGNFIDLTYTATMERTLDEIAEGKRPWEPVITEAVMAFVEIARKAGLQGDPFAPGGADAGVELPKLPDGARLVPCRTCGQEIGFVEVQGRWVPVNPDSTSHRQVCSGKERGRGRGKRRAG
jgi:DNA topoisomerase-1